MYQLVLLIHIVLCAVLIGLVLMQRGKGASMGAAFGAGASATVFGSQGSGSFLLKITAVLAACFFATSMGLGYIAAKQNRSAQEISIPVQERTQIPLLEQNTVEDSAAEESQED